MSQLPCSTPLRLCVKPSSLKVLLSTVSQHKKPVCFMNYNSGLLYLKIFTDFLRIYYKTSVSNYIFLT